MLGKSKEGCMQRRGGSGGGRGHQGLVYVCVPIHKGRAVATTHFHSNQLLLLSDFVISF